MSIPPSFSGPSVVLAEIGKWLRGYQRRFLNDYSLRRLYLKSRQIGITEAIALEMVLVSSGFLKEYVLLADCSIISKDEEAAKEVIAKATTWADILSLDPELGYLFELATRNAKSISFKHSGRKLKALAQSKNAGRSVTGHLYLDEYAFYRFQARIWGASTPSTSSKPGLRITVISTPNGTGEHFHALCTTAQGWSRHYTDIYQAVADGHPGNPETIRTTICKNDADFRQEFCCDFTATSAEYIPRHLFEASIGTRTTSSLSPVTYVGIDVASEIDLTAVHVMLDAHGQLWNSDTYVLVGLPYTTGYGKGGVVGQDTVIDGLLRVLGPYMTVMDATGDGAQIFGYMVAMGHNNLIPHTFTRGWKEDVVPDLRGAYERGKLKTCADRRDLSCASSLAHELAAEFVDPETRRIPTEKLNEWHARIWQPMSHPQLLMDTLKLRRTLTKDNNVTYTTTRDTETGHGDALWAKVMAFDVARHARLADPMDGHDTIVDHEWVDDRMKYL